MKIAFDAKRAFHNFTGLGNYSRTLIESLVKYYPENEYILYTPPLKKKVAFEWYEKISALGNIKLITPRFFIFKLFPSLWRSIFLSWVIKKERPDIFHGISHELPPLIHKTGIKSVVTIHDLIFLRYPKLFGLIDKYVFTHKYRYSCRHADRIVAICEQTNRDVVNYLNADNSKIDVVYQSCDPCFYELLEKEELEKIRNKYFLPHKFVLYVGSLCERKNLIHLLCGYNLFNKSHDIPLVLVGNGIKYRKKLENFIKKMGLQNYVIFLNYVPSCDLPGLYQNASLFVYPSFFEGFGIPIIESFFCKTPVITSTGSCFKETGGDAAQYIDPKNSDELGMMIKKFTENEEFSKESILKGISWVQKFHIENTSKNMIEVYKSVINQR